MQHAACVVYTVQLAVELGHVSSAEAESHGLANSHAQYAGCFYRTSQAGQRARSGCDACRGAPPNTQQHTRNFVFHLTELQERSYRGMPN